MPVGGSVRGLSVAGGAGPAQVGFTDEGDAIVVTEKATSQADQLPRARRGSLRGAPIITASPA